MSALPIEPSKSAIGPDPRPRWSDLPTDVLIDILQRLELPGSIAFAAVCLSWRSTATAVGVPASRTPWLMSWANPPEEKGVWPKPDLDNPTSCEFRSVLNAEKAYEARFPQGRFPQGRFLYCCGASHGWLIASDELCNLALYNPFTSTTAPLPQITDFKSRKDLYDDEGNLVDYGGRDELFNVKTLSGWFYQKAILSCTPCAGSDCIAMVIIRGADWLAFARAGEGPWRLASTIAKGSNDIYADCVYHNGRFYTVTMRGAVEMWDLVGSYKLKKEVIVSWKQGVRDVRDVPPIVARH